MFKSYCDLTTATSQCVARQLSVGSPGIVHMSYKVVAHNNQSIVIKDHYTPHGEKIL